MSLISCIVEGHGEVAALPVLLRRFITWRSPDCAVSVEYPIRVSRGRFLNRPSEFSRYLQLARAKCGVDGWVLVVLDADDDCPAICGPEILARVRGIVSDCFVSVVLANREFESWFIGAASSLQDVRGLHVDVADLMSDPEAPRDAKGWLRIRMDGGTYGETTDQPAFAARMDLQLAFDRCRSFRKLCHEWDARFG